MILEWYNNKYDNGFDADNISISNGQNIKIDAVLELGGAISGRVTNLSGVGIPNVYIESVNIQKNYWNSGKTDANGNYIIQGIRTGASGVSVVAVSSDPALKYYLYKSYPGLVNVNPGVTTNNINIQLETGGRIAGKVTDQNGKGITNFKIWIYDSVNKPLGYENSPFGQTDGSYMTRALTPGNYKIKYEPPSNLGLLTEWYNNRYDINSANLITVVKEQDTPINIQLSSSQEVEITDIEINQVLGRQINNPPSFVAGKDTAIRVFLSSPVRVNATTQRLIVKRDGNTITTLYPKPSSTNTNVLTYVCPNQNSCGNWQFGNYIFEASVQGSNLSKTATFVERKGIRILAVPVSVTDRGNVNHLPDKQWMDARGFLNKVYPISNDGLVWTNDSTELNAQELDLTKEGDREALWGMLNRRQPFLCGFLGRPKCYDKIIGFIPPMPICGFMGCIVGWTITDPSCVIMANGWVINSNANDSWLKDDMQAMVAHEVGHTYNLGDEYHFGAYQCQINPPPADYKGCEWPGGCDNYDFACQASTALSWYGTGASGSMVVSEQDYPFEVVGGNLLTDRLSFMGTGGKQSHYWITPDIYAHLFNSLPPLTLSGTLQDTDTSIQVIEISGKIGKDNSIAIQPMYHFITSSVNPVIGNYTIEAVDDGGQILASQGFEISFVALDNPPRAIDPAPFKVAVAFPAGTKAFQIKHGNTLLLEVPVSSNKPTVNITAPNSGSQVSGNYTISWQSGDLDGDQLHHIVEYSHNGQDWIVLAANITEKQFVANFDTLPGGSQCQIRVIVSDGVNTNEALSVPFIVGNKAPQVFISNPTLCARNLLGMNLTLNGSAYDMQDGWLHNNSSLVWTSDRDGLLGNGEILNLTTLSNGKHIITLSGTNSLGLTSSKNVETEIGNWIYLPILIKK